MRMKKTEVCQTCAKLKNVCQTCILDLQYGLPVQVRDTALAIADSVPKNEVNREYYIQNAEKTLEDGSNEFNKSNPAGHELLKRLARNQPYYQRNKAHICSFFVKGQCNRGTECPYRHEMPKDDEELAKQNIKDRYAGSEDPVAKRLLNRANKNNSQAPEDKSVTSIFLSGLTSDIQESDIRDYFYAYGVVKSVVVVSEKKIAFVNYVTRSSAEQAIEKSMGIVNINNQPIRVAWAKAQAQGPRSNEDSGQYGQTSESDNYSGYNYFVAPPPPPSFGTSYYPSQDPKQLGSSKNLPGS